jgi:hypothetical protein
MTPYTYEASLEDEDDDSRMPTSLIVAFLLGIVAAVVVVFG